MGTSYIELDEYGFWCNDGLLELWLLCVVREIENLPQAPDWLQEVIEEWLIISTIGSSGSIWTNLTKYAAEGERRKIIVELSLNALNRLETEKDTQENDLYVVPADRSSHVAEGWLSNEINDLHLNARHNLKMTGIQFISLLRGEWLYSNPAEETWSWRQYFKYL